MLKIIYIGINAQNDIYWHKCTKSEKVATDHPLPRIPNSSSSVTFFSCAMDLGNRESYHRSAGVKTTVKKF